MMLLSAKKKADAGLEKASICLGEENGNMDCESGCDLGEVGL